MNCYTCFKYNYFSIKLKLRDETSCLWSNFSVELPPVLVPRSLATGADILVPEPGVVTGLPVVNKIGDITVPVRPLHRFEVEHWLGITQDSVEPIAVIVSRQFHPQSVHFQAFIGGQNKLVSSPEWISELVSDRCLLGVKISLAGKTIFGVQSPIFLLFIIFVMVVHLESLNVLYNNLHISPLCPVVLEDVGTFSRSGKILPLDHLLINFLYIGCVLPNWRVLLPRMSCLSSGSDLGLDNVGWGIKINNKIRSQDAVNGQVSHLPIVSLGGFVNPSLVEGSINVCPVTEGGSLKNNSLASVEQMLQDVHILEISVHVEVPQHSVKTSILS